MCQTLNEGDTLLYKRLKMAYNLMNSPGVAGKQQYGEASKLGKFLKIHCAEYICKHFVNY